MLLRGNIWCFFYSSIPIFVDEAKGTGSDAMIRIIPAYNRTRVKKYYTACLNQARRPNQRLQEMIGHLRGNLAARLELERFPVQIVINYLADNFHPATDKQLTPRTKERGNKKRGKGGKRIGMRRVIFDSGFFLPKGVSLLGVLLDIREVVTLVVTASHETMLDIEKMAGTRMRLEGVLDGGRGIKAPSPRHSRSKCSIHFTSF